MESVPAHVNESCHASGFRFPFHTVNSYCVHLVRRYRPDSFASLTLLKEEERLREWHSRTEDFEDVANVVPILRQPCSNGDRSGCLAGQGNTYTFRRKRDTSVKRTLLKWRLIARKCCLHLWRRRRWCSAVRIGRLPCTASSPGSDDTGCGSFCPEPVSKKHVSNPSIRGVLTDGRPLREMSLTWLFCR